MSQSILSLLNRIYNESLSPSLKNFLFILISPVLISFCGQEIVTGVVLISGLLIIISLFVKKYELSKYIFPLKFLSVNILFKFIDDVLIARFLISNLLLEILSGFIAIKFFP